MTRFLKIEVNPADRPVQIYFIEIWRLFEFTTQLSQRGIYKGFSGWI